MNYWKIRMIHVLWWTDKLISIILVKTRTKLELSVSRLCGCGTEPIMNRWCRKMLDTKNLTNLKQNVDMTKKLYTSQVETSLQFSLSWTRTVSLELGRSCFWILQCDWSFLLWTFGLFSCVTIKTFIEFLCFYISEDSVLQSLKSLVLLGDMQFIFKLHCPLCQITTSPLINPINQT